MKAAFAGWSGQASKQVARFSCVAGRRTVRQSILQIVEYPSTSRTKGQVGKARHGEAATDQVHAVGGGAKRVIDVDFAVARCHIGAIDSGLIQDAVVHDGYVSHVDRLEVLCGIVGRSGHVWLAGVLASRRKKQQDYE